MFPHRECHSGTTPGASQRRRHQSTLIAGLRQYSLNPNSQKPKPPSVLRLTASGELFSKGSTSRCLLKFTFESRLQVLPAVYACAVFASVLLNLPKGHSSGHSLLNYSVQPRSSCRVPRSRIPYAPVHQAQHCRQMLHSHCCRGIQPAKGHLL